MTWTLTLANFDGQIRGCLSLLSAGVGLLWALLDEESLDRMSKTFAPY
jgi:hypothetical protein